MWAVAVAIAGFVAQHVVVQVILGVIAAAMVACWDDWGKDLFIAIAAIVCIVGLIYVSVAAGFTSLGWSVCAQDIAIIVIAGIIGMEKLLEWFTAVVEWIIEIFAYALAALLEVLDEAFPFLKPMLYGGLAFLAYKLVSGGSKQPTIVYGGAVNPQSVRAVPNGTVPVQNDVVSTESPNSAVSVQTTLV